MKVRVRYNGVRADTLREYGLKAFREGPYDFSKGSCEMDEADAEILCRRDPRGFTLVKPKKRDTAKKPAVAKKPVNG